MSCITEILKLKGDKKVLIPEGEWIAVESGGTYKGYEYIIVLNKNAFRCGYVAIPESHPYSNTPLEKRGFNGKEWDHYDYNTLDIECHGGLTFMSPKHDLKDLLPIACNDMWIGFDCGHLWDACDIDAFIEYFGREAAQEKMEYFDAMDAAPGATCRSYTYAKKECESIIDQIIQEEAA